MLLTLFVLAIQDPVTPSVDKEAVLSRRAKGSSTVTCDSPWHPKMALQLAPGGRLKLRAEELAALLPPEPPVKPGTSWTVKGEKLMALATALTDFPWKIDDGKNDAWVQWQGDTPLNRVVSADGELKVTLEKTAKGLSLAVAGTLTVTDAGHLGSRYGPNDWKTAATHKISARLSLTAAARIDGFELKDDVDLEGSFSNGAQFVEAFTQKSTFETVEPRALTAERENAARALVARLGDDSFDAREKATKALIDMGDEIVPLLTAVRSDSTDAEVKARLDAILKALD